MAGSPLERLRSRARKGFRGYPIATVAFYGPTNEVASKVAVSTISSDGAEAEVVGRWYNTELAGCGKSLCPAAPEFPRLG
jgi:hypothetical protein